MRKLIQRWKTFFNQQPVEMGEWMRTTTFDPLTMVGADYIERAVLKMVADGWRRNRRIPAMETLRVIVKRPKLAEDAPIDTISTIGWRFVTYRHLRWWRDPSGFGLWQVLQAAQQIKSAVAKAMPAKVA